MKTEISKHDRIGNGHNHDRQHHPDAELQGPGEGRSHRDSGGRRHGGGPGGRHGRGADPFGGPRERAKRGEAKFILLDALRGGPKHGYEIIKGLEERSGGEYVPSPGTVYPTMQYLEEAGLVQSSQDAERRQYQLTDAGLVELATQAEQVVAFWSRFSDSTTSSASRAEVGFVIEEMENLQRTVWGAVRAIAANENQERIRRVRQAIGHCREEIRDIIAQGAAA